MYYLKFLIEVLVVVSCLVLTSCKQSAGNNSEGISRGADSPVFAETAGKLMDKYMSTCKITKIISDHAGAAVALYKCPSSITTDLTKKINKEKCKEGDITDDEDLSKIALCPLIKSSMNNGEANTVGQYMVEATGTHADEFMVGNCADNRLFVCYL